MSLDRWIAVFFLLFSFVYGYAAWNYTLLPFERNMVFLPNTLPIGLAGFGILFSLIIIFAKRDPDLEADPGGIDLTRLGDYKFGQAGALILLMIVYALAIRPIGFIASTTLFLVLGGVVLGERKFHILILAGVLGSGSIWYLVQEVLGVFLRPWPWFLG